MVSRAGTGVLLGGLVLVAAYAVTAVVFGGFALPTGADYITLREALRQVGVDQVLIRDLAPHAAVADVARLVLLLPAAVLLALWLAPRWPARTLAPAARLLEAPRHRAALTATTLATAGLLVVWARAVFGGQPVFDDEFTYLFQARTLASGWLAAPAPPCAPCFENVFIIIRDGLWVGKYTSGHPALVALSLLLGSPYLLPLLLAALVPLLVYLIARETDDAATGLIAAALLVISPFFLMTAATLMNHGTNLFFLALFVLAYLRARRGRAWIRAIVAGLAIGIALNIRPQTAVAVGVPFAIWTLVRLRGGGRPVAIVTMLGVVAGALAPVVYAGYYNHVVAGAWYRFPFLLLEGDAPAAGAFLAFTDQGDPGHTLWKGLFYGLLNVWRLNGYLFGWGASLLPAVVALLRGPLSAHDRTWLGVAAVTVAIHAGFPSPGVLELGPRYLFPLLVPVAIWSARGLVIAHDWLVAHGRPRTLVPAFVMVSVVLALGTFTREQAVHLRTVTGAVARPYRFVESRDLDEAIVLVRAKPPSGWVFGLRNNHPRLEDNDVVYVKLTGLDNVVALLDAMPDRRVFVLAFDPEDPSAEPELVPFSPARLRQMREEAGRGRTP